MISESRHCDPKPGRFFLLSFTLHLAAILICSYTAIFKPVLHEATPYYVDIISLPEPEPAPAPAAPEPLPAAPAAATPVVPLKPAAPPARTPAASPLPSPTAPAARDGRGQEGRGQEAKEFAQRMSRLERSSEERRQAEAFASLQKRVADRKGSDYGAYIQSRLKDALATTMFYRSKAPEAAVRLYIDKKGKLVRYVMERPSADKLFNDSVMRTIEKAKVNFPPPATNSDFEKLYVFSPQEVTN